MTWPESERVLRQSRLASVLRELGRRQEALVDVPQCEEVVRGALSDATEGAGLLARCVVIGGRSAMRTGPRGEILR